MGVVGSQQLPECPTSEELLSKNNYPKTRQINSETSEIDWTHLWPDMDWSTCVTSVEILVQNNVLFRPKLRLNPLTTPSIPLLYPLVDKCAWI